MLEHEVYNFSQISTTSYLVTGNKFSIIIYKAKAWRCADDVPKGLVARLGEIVDQRLGNLKFNI
jgi:hypothetical protein